MMILRQYEESPLRIYVEGDDSEISRLLSSLMNRFYQEKKEYDRDEDRDIENIIIEQEGSYYFPAGLLSIVLAEMRQCHIEYTLLVLPALADAVVPEIDENILEGITLREYQCAGIRVALQKRKGLLQLGTGAGKTEMMIAIGKYLLENKEGNILLCVPTADLLHQTYDRIVSRGIPEYEIAKFGDGNKLDKSKRLIVSTIQTAYRRLEDEEFKEWYGELLCIMLDEAQHGACRTWYTLIDCLSPEYIIGVSAEPFYGDKDHVVRDLILRGTVGPVLYRVPMNYLVDHGYLSKPYVVALDTKYPGNIHRVIDWHTVNKMGIINNPLRNEAICTAASVLINMGKNPLILIQQIAHGKKLAELISQCGSKVAVYTGGMKVSVYVDGREIDSFRDTGNQTKDDFQRGVYGALIGTSVLDEGADIPALSSVILAGGSKSRLRIIQRIGRGLRKKDGENLTFIIDFQDRFNVVLHSHHKKRKNLFTEHNIPVYYCNDLSKLPSFFHSIIDQRNREISNQGS